MDGTERILKVEGVLPYFLFRYLVEDNLIGRPIPSLLVRVGATHSKGSTR